MADRRARYAWRATYTDGAVLECYDAFGREHPQSAIDQERCCQLDLLPREPGFPPIRVLLRPERGEHVVKFWLVDQPLRGGPPAEEKEVLVLAQQTSSGEAVRTYLLLHSDGQIVLSGSEDY